MRKLSIVLVTALTLGFVITSCDKDDDKDNNKPLINGKWYYSKEGIGLDNQEALTDYPWHIPGCSKDFVEFLDNGVLKATLHTDEQCATEEEISSYTYEKNKLTIVYDGEITNAEVVKLTEDELKIREISDTNDGQTAYDYLVFTRNQ